jgi:hypothetical protein
MLTFGSLPPTEKIYLADKTLVTAQELKIGDKILSLKITQNGINNISDIFTNIIDNNNRIVYDYEICEATVFSSQIEERSNYIRFNKNKIKGSQYIITNPYALKGIQNFEEYLEKRKTSTIDPFMISNLDEVKFMASYNTRDLTLRKINKDFLPDLSDLFKEIEIQKFELEKTAISYALTLLNGHFYFTENFIVLAEAGE